MIANAGVPVAQVGSHTFIRPLTSTCPEPTHIAFPEPIASRLVDPDDPQVRERIDNCLCDLGTDLMEVTPLSWAILAALKEANHA